MGGQVSTDQRYARARLKTRAHDPRAALAMRAPHDAEIPSFIKEAVAPALAELHDRPAAAAGSVERQGTFSKNSSSLNGPESSVSQYSQFIDQISQKNDARTSLQRTMGQNHAVAYEERLHRHDCEDDDVDDSPLKKKAMAAAHRAASTAVMTAFGAPEMNQRRRRRRRRLSLPIRELEESPAKRGLSKADRSVLGATGEAALEEEEFETPQKDRNMFRRNTSSRSRSQRRASIGAIRMTPQEKRQLLRMTSVTSFSSAEFDAESETLEEAKGDELDQAIKLLKERNARMPNADASAVLDALVSYHQDIRSQDDQYGFQRSTSGLEAESQPKPKSRRRIESARIHRVKGSTIANNSDISDNGRNDQSGLEETNENRVVDMIQQLLHKLDQRDQSQTPKRALDATTSESPVRSSSDSGAIKAMQLSPAVLASIENSRRSRVLRQVQKVKLKLKAVDGFRQSIPSSSASRVASIIGENDPLRSEAYESAGSGDALPKSVPGTNGDSRDALDIDLAGESRRSPRSSDQNRVRSNDRKKPKKKHKRKHKKHKKHKKKNKNRKEESIANAMELEDANAIEDPGETERRDPLINLDGKEVHAFVPRKTRSPKTLDQAESHQNRRRSLPSVLDIRRANLLLGEPVASPQPSYPESKGIDGDLKGTGGLQMVETSRGAFVCSTTSLQLAFEKRMQQQASEFASRQWKLPRQQQQQELPRQSQPSHSGWIPAPPSSSRPKSALARSTHRTRRMSLPLPPKASLATASLAPSAQSLIQKLRAEDAPNCRNASGPKDSVLRPKSSLRRGSLTLRDRMTIRAGVRPASVPIGPDIALHAGSFV